MFSIYLLFALIFSTVGSPFPASSHEFDDPGSISSNFAGSDVLGSDTLSAAKEVPNAGTTPIFSLASSPDDSFFTDESSGYSGLGSLDPTISVNLPSNLAISGIGADEDMFGSTTLDDGLQGGLFDSDGSVQPFDVAAQYPNGVASACVSEVIQSIAKQKRVACQNPETEIKPDADTQTENQVESQKRPLLDEDTLRRMSGLDQPDLLRTDICMESFESVCCTGQDYLGLLQTGCSKCMTSSWWRCHLISFLLLLTYLYRFSQRLEKYGLL